MRQAKEKKESIKKKKVRLGIILETLQKKKDRCKTAKVKGFLMITDIRRQKSISMLCSATPPVGLFSVSI